MLNKKNGFTLIEIIVAIALLGLLAVVFIPSMTSHFLWMVNTKTSITQEVFAEQDMLETKIKLVQNALNSGDIDSEDYDFLGISDKLEIKLFESSFIPSSYPSRQYPSAYKIYVDEGYVTLVGDKRLPELPVPTIIGQSLILLQDGGNSLNKYEYFNYSALKLKATSNMIENPSNSFNRYRSDWYVSKPGFNIPVQDVGNIDEEYDFGRIYPRFPDDYNAIPIHTGLGSAYTYVSLSERIINVELDSSFISQYPGRHIMYTITPFAKSLKQGITSSILPKYIYGPDVTNNLALHYDASTIDMNDIYHSSSNSTGSLMIQDNKYNLRNWKSSRPSVKNPTLNQRATQTNIDNMPILLRNDDINDPYTGHAIPFQEGATNTRVWSRVLGNKGITMSTMTISNIPNNSMTNDWTLFMIVRKVDVPLGPTIGTPIFSGNNWSIEWKEISSDLGLSFTRGTVSTTPLNIENKEWYLVQATSKSSPGEIFLKISSLKRGTNTIIENTAISSTNMNTRNIKINWNGIELAELLVYNANMNNSDLTTVESYLINKYNPDL